MLLSPPEAQIFVSFAVWWANFCVTSQLCESALNTTPKWPWYCTSNAPICISHTPLGPKFSSVSLYRMSHFCVTAKFWEKCNQMTPKWPWQVQGQRIRMQSTYTTEAQIFVCFSLWWSVFEETKIFEFPMELFIIQIILCIIQKLNLYSTNVFHQFMFQIGHFMGSTNVFLCQFGCKTQL